MGNRSLLTVHCSPTSTFTVLVTGESMWPVLVPGRRYTARRGAEPRVGDIVVAQHPTDSSTTIVKRVTAIQASSEQPHFAVLRRGRQAVSSKGTAVSDRSPFTAHRSLFTLTGTVSWSSTFTVPRSAILGVVVI